MKFGTKIVIVLGTTIIIALILFAVDLSRVYKNENPIFCVKTVMYKDGGSAEYLGLGYKVIKYVNLVDSSTIYKIGTWFMEFNKPLMNNPINSISPNITNIEYESMNIQTHLYIEGMNSPQTDIIKSTNDLDKYIDKFKDDTLKDKLSKYNDEYFKNKVLVIVTIAESSGSNTNKIDRISKLEGSDTLDVFVERKVSEIGTADMAMWHLIAEIDNNDFKDIQEIEVHDSSVKYQ